MNRRRGDIPQRADAHEPITPSERFEGDTFALTIDAIEPLTHLQARALALHQQHAPSFEKLIKLLGIKANAKQLEQAALAIATATQDLSAFDATMRRKLCAQLHTQAQNKRALGEALWLDKTMPLTRLGVSVTTCFDVTRLQETFEAEVRPRLTWRLRGCALEVIHEQLEAKLKLHLILARKLKYSGNDPMTLTLELLAEPSPALSVGQRFTSAVDPFTTR